MRIAQVLHGSPAHSMGGTGLYVDAISRALIEDGHSVALVAPGPPPATPAQTPCEQFFLEGEPPTTWDQTWHRPDLEAQWRRWLRRWAPDVVHFHHLGHLSLGQVRGAREAGVHVVLTLHDYAIPCARGQLVNGDLQPCEGPQAARCARCLGENLQPAPALRALGKRLQSWPSVHSAARKLLRRLPPAATATERVTQRMAAVSDCLQAAHVLLSPSVDLATRMEAMGHPRPQLCHLPLLHGGFVPGPAPDPGPVRFLFAATIVPTKAPHLVLAAFARLPGGAASLTIAGHCPHWEGTSAFSDRLQERVRTTAGAHWRGPVKHDEMVGLMQAHDVLLLPSIWPENSPITVREATAIGLRVIASHGGTREIAPRCRIVPPGDVHALTKALQEELTQGRARTPPATWPTPSEHVEWLLAHTYQHSDPSALPALQ